MIRMQVGPGAHHGVSPPEASSAGVVRAPAGRTLRYCRPAPPARSPPCPAPPRTMEGSLPGGPPAKRQGDYTPARRGQFGPRRGTWARLAPCGDGQCGPPGAAEARSPPISPVRPPQSRLLARPQGSRPGDTLSSEATQPSPLTGCGWRLLKAAGLRSPTSLPRPGLTVGPAGRRANEWPHVPGAWRAQRDPPQNDWGGEGPSQFSSASPQIQSLRFNLLSGYKGHIPLQR